MVPWSILPLQTNETWKTGTCIEKLSDRSYVVKTNSDNQVLRRNREFLKPAEQPAAQTQPIVVTESPPAKCDVQTPVPEQKQMYTPSRPAFQLSRRHVPEWLSHPLGSRTLLLSFQFKKMSLELQWTLVIVLLKHWLFYRYYFVSSVTFIFCYFTFHFYLLLFLSPKENLSSYHRH